MTKNQAAASAAYLIILQINEIIIVFAVGYSEYAAIISSQFGRDYKSQTIFYFTLRTVQVSIATIGLASLAIYIFITPITELILGKSEWQRAEAFEYVRSFAGQSMAFLIIDATALVLMGILRGRSITGGPLVANLVSFWVVGFPLLICFGKYSANHIWIAVQASFLAVLFGNLYFFYKTQLQKNRSFS